MKRGLKGILLCIAMIVAVMLAMVPAKMVHAAKQEGDLDGGIYDSVDWRITSDYELIIGDGTEQTFTYRSNRNSSPVWCSGYGYQVKSVRFDGIVHGQGDMSRMFSYLSNLESFDVTGFDTQRVTNMNFMFENCSKLTSLDLSSFDVRNVTSMEAMFRYCYALESLNLSSFDTRSVRTMKDMFRQCQNLQSLDLSSFNTNQVTDMSWMFYDCEKLTTLDVSNFDTRNVTNMDYMFASMASMHELDLSSFYTPSLQSCMCMLSWSPIEFIDVRNFDMRQMTNPDQFASMLYAQTSNYGTYKYHLKKFMIGPNFRFGLPPYYDCRVGLNEPSNSNYIVNDSYLVFGWRNVEANTEAYVESSNYKNDFRALTRAYYNDSESLAGTWEYTVDTFNVHVSFDGGDGVTGSMPEIHVEKGVPEYKAGNYYSINLPANTYAKPGYEFDHWALDSSVKSHSGILSDKVVSDGGKIYWTHYINSNDIGTKDVHIKFNAVWRRTDFFVNMEDGSFTFDIKAGEKATFNDIPAGTSYQVYELTPDGWVLVQQENASGVIEALEESAVSFWNKYQPDIVTVQFTGTKKLDGHPAKLGTYQFELLDENRNVIQTKFIVDGGFIQFDPIEYTKADLGEHTYIIREIDPQDNSIDYDTHEETVKVLVGQLAGDVESVNVVSHSSNILDNGVKKYDYSSSTYYTDVITIPGADKLHVTVKYTNPRGQFYVWQGAHEEVRTQTYGADFNPNTALKQYHYINGKDQEYLTDEFDVEGDSLSVLYNSYAYPTTNNNWTDMVNYGYYMTVTADLPVEGALTADVTYDEDGVAFDNHTRPGVLKITKDGSELTEANKDDTFTFEITFSNENGMPISDNIYWYVENQN